MKKFIATICILGSAAALSACTTEGEGNRELQPPYAQERTAGHSPAPAAKAAPAERVFHQKQVK
ncbi:MAG: hypothetical protein CMH27_01185 [Micavibrio sp.]|nr:hypothetical protein [Micavibrio sp.]|tara:strand:+ start:363 stop:554 length:192 start_codon:yes stop_codon:yes gene_type:complete